MAESKTDYSSYILPVGLVLIGYTVLQKFGLVPSQESKATEAAALSLRSFKPFNPNFIKNTINSKGTPGQQFTVKKLTPARAAAVALQLKKAKGIFNDNEDAIYSVFRTLEYQSQVSQIAAEFLKLTKLELLTYLESFMNQKELAQIADIINVLPLGITPKK